MTSLIASRTSKYTGFVFNTSILIRSVISRSVKELLKQIAIRGMYFYPSKPAFTAFAAEC
jgi:hypothetical protein